MGDAEARGRAPLWNAAERWPGTRTEKGPVDSAVNTAMRRWAAPGSGLPGGDRRAREEESHAMVERHCLFAFSLCT